eukprot:23214-Eustigmatos_ZCMA.PRE.1
MDPQQPVNSNQLKEMIQKLEEEKQQLLEEIERLRAKNESLKDDVLRALVPGIVFLRDEVPDDE